MSRQLSRIRSIISEIDEIQKQGQTEGKAHLQQRVPNFVTTPVVEPSPEVIAPVYEMKPRPTEELKNGKVSIQMTGNITVALQIENSDEVVEVRQIENAIEIRFVDGKAFHLPLKNVA